MRTLTVDEISVVSGGEAPCMTLRTPCVGPTPSARQMSNAMAAAALALQGSAQKSSNKRTKAFLEALALGAATAAQVFAWLEE